MIPCLDVSSLSVGACNLQNQLNEDVLLLVTFKIVIRQVYNIRSVFCHALY